MNDNNDYGYDRHTNWQIALHAHGNNTITYLEMEVLCYGGWPSYLCSNLS